MNEVFLNQGIVHQVEINKKTQAFVLLRLCERISGPERNRTVNLFVRNVLSCLPIWENVLPIALDIRQIAAD